MHSLPDPPQLQQRSQLGQPDPGPPTRHWQLAQDTRRPPRCLAGTPAFSCSRLINMYSVTGEAQPAHVFMRVLLASACLTAAVCATTVRSRSAVHASRASCSLSTRAWPSQCELRAGRKQSLLVAADDSHSGLFCLFALFLVAFSVSRSWRAVQCRWHWLQKLLAWAAIRCRGR